MNGQKGSTSKRWFGPEIAIVLGVAVNFVFSFISFRTGLPVYLDTIGTISVSMIAGIFPGIVTAVIGNVLCSVFDPYSVYYSLINAMTAIISGSFIRRYEKRDRAGKLPLVIVFIFILALTGGVAGDLFDHLLNAGTRPGSFGDALAVTAETGGYPLFSGFLKGTGLNLADKGVSVLIALLIYRLTPAGLKERLRISPWKQTPLTDEEKDALKKSRIRHSLFRRVSVTLVSVGLILAVALGGISIVLYNRNVKAQYTENARNAARFASRVIDPHRVDQYVEHGRSVPGYIETEGMLYDILDNSNGVRYLYVVQVRDNECRMVFDVGLGTPYEPCPPGELMGPDKVFEQSLPWLFEGEDIPPVESDDGIEWLLTLYEPVKDEAGNTVCYACADVSMDYLSDYVVGFLVRTILIFSGLFVLIIASGLWLSEYYLFYPISSMTECAKSFKQNADDPGSLEKKVRMIRNLNIRTDDEVEELYKSLCRMSEDVYEQYNTLSEQYEKLRENERMLQERDAELRNDQRKLKEQMEIISSIVGIYNSMYELDLENETFRELRAENSSVDDLDESKKVDVQQIIYMLIKKTVDPSSIDLDLMEGVDIPTISERMRDTDVWTKEVMNLEKQWRRCRIIVVNRDPDGKIIRVLWLSEDIDKEKRDRERLIDMSERAVAANEAKSSFLSNMSHEIRTPINAVLGMNEMILRESSEEAVLEYAENIRTAGSTLLSLVNDILDFSRIEAGKMEIIPVEYDLSSVINDLVNMIHTRAEDKGLTLSLDIDGGTPRYLYGDEVRIKQVITNILTNAVKYTEEGTVTFSVGFERQEDLPDRVILCVAVKDTGMGIKKEDMNRLFSRFDRIEEKRNRSVEGTGLGISIIVNLLEMMDSSLQVESVYGEGSTFSFKLAQRVVRWEPVGDYEASFRSAAAKHRKYREKFTAPDARILVTDDTEMNLKVFRSLLKRTLLRIDTAGSGNECLELSAKDRYDLIFLDHMMPDKDGIETLHELRQQEEGPNIRTPVVCLTANAISGAREKYLSAGFDDYLTKPIDADRLEELLIRYLPPEKVRITSGTSPGETGSEEAGASQDPGDGMNATLPGWLLQCGELDVKAGVRNCGGAEEYLDVLEGFYSTIPGKADEIEGYLREDDIRNYTVRVHALKSSARIIGAGKLSEMARLLEEAGNEGRTDVIREKTGELLDEYRSFSGILSPLAREDEGLPEITEDTLEDAYAAVEEFSHAKDYDLTRMVMGSVKEYRLPPEDAERFRAIEEKLSRMDWDGILEILGSRKA